MNTEPGSPLEIRTDLRDAGHAVVSVRGEVDLDTAPELERRLGEVVERGTPVIVDLRECAYMDSSGFRALHRTAGIGRIALVVPGDAFLARVVHLAGLTEIVDMFDDVPAAAAHLRAASE